MLGIVYDLTAVVVLVGPSLENGAPLAMLCWPHSAVELPFLHNTPAHERRAGHDITYVRHAEQWFCFDDNCTDVL